MSDAKEDTTGSIPVLGGMLAGNVSLDVAHSNPGGAPIEDESPLGRNVGWWSAVFLNFSDMIGTGIFSTPGTILSQTGSVGLAFIFWVIGFLFACSGLACYTELAATFPNRAGAQVAYLEQAYKRPRFLFPVTFAAVVIILSFASQNAIICAQYLLFARGVTDPDQWELRGIAIACYAVVCLIVITHNRMALLISNTLAAFKIAVLVLIVVTGWAILGGGTRVKDSHSHFSRGFEGSNNNGNALASAMISVIFSYAGWNNANTVTNEIKNPIRTLKTAGPVALVIVFFLYIFVNVSFIAAVPLEAAKESGQLLAGAFFTAVFGDYTGQHVLPVFIALSAFGNLIAGAIGEARIFREVARQGMFPFSRFFASTKPFGTPAAPMLFKFLLTSIVIIAPPPGDAFNLIISIQTYPAQLFDLALLVGIFVIRRWRAREGLTKPEYAAWSVAIGFAIVVDVFVLVMPWIPPAADAQPFSFSYWVPWVTSIGIVVASVAYYIGWMFVVPWVREYRIYELVVEESHGERFKQFVKVYNDERGDEMRRRIAMDTPGQPHSSFDPGNDSEKALV